MKIRVATIKDYSELLTLSKLLNKEYMDSGEKIQTAIGASLVWVAELDEQIVGYVMCELFDQEHEQFPSSVFISELLVDEKFRKHGIGKQLLDTVLKAKFPVEYTRFTLCHDPKEKYLTEFYQFCGFTVIGATNVGNVKMEKWR